MPRYLPRLSFTRDPRWATMLTNPDCQYATCPADLERRRLTDNGAVPGGFAVRLQAVVLEVLPRRQAIPAGAWLLAPGEVEASAAR